MKKKCLSIAAAILICLPVKSWSEAYLCVSDKSTGFHYDEVEKEWKTARFGDGEKYIISRSKYANEEPFAPTQEQCRWCDDCYHHALWMVQKFGETDTVLAWCRDGYDTFSAKPRLDGFTGRSGEDDDYLVCDKSGGDYKFRFSKKNMRFMLVNTDGFWLEGHVDNRVYTQKTGKYEDPKGTPFIEIGQCTEISL